MKQKEKGIKTDEQQLQSNEKGLNEIKRLKQKQNDFLKAQQDADASGDGDLSLKLQKKIDDIGGQINFKNDKMEAKIVKEHRKIQSKETRKRMKQNSKKSNRLNDNRREPFYERWYKKWKGKGKK